MSECRICPKRGTELVACDLLAKYRLRRQPPLHVDGSDVERRHQDWTTSLEILYSLGYGRTTSDLHVMVLDTWKAHDMGNVRGIPEAAWHELAARLDGAKQ